MKWIKKIFGIDNNLEEAHRYYHENRKTINDMYFSTVIAKKPISKSSPSQWTAENWVWFINNL